MSNPLAIAATTATLRNLLLGGIPLRDGDLADLEVTAQPPDLARKSVTKAQLNLFLYGVAINAAWRNLDVPRQVRPGETAPPPLALNLHYLLTSYGRGESDNDAVSHRVLGAAMSVLHDHVLLGADEIAAALPGNDLSQQFERLRITPLAMGLEEMSKLWMTFQTQYRTSVAYELSVLLIDSRARGRSALPVLTRGESDRGVQTFAGRTPRLTALEPPHLQPAAMLGDDVTLRGDGIAGAVVRFESTRVQQGAAPGGGLPIRSVELAPIPGARPDEVTVHLPLASEDPGALGRWVPGFYTVVVIFQTQDAPPSSGAVAFALAPRVAVSPTAAPRGTIELTVTCEPRIGIGQSVTLLFGDRQVEPTSISTPSDPAKPTTVAFRIANVADTGKHVVRLRVDGVDSIPVVRTGSPPIPFFDPNQTVDVT